MKCKNNYGSAIAKHFIAISTVELDNFIIEFVIHILTNMAHK